MCLNPPKSSHLFFFFFLISILECTPCCTIGPGHLKLMQIALMRWENIHKRWSRHKDGFSTAGLLIQCYYNRHKLSRDVFSVPNQQCTFLPPPFWNIMTASVMAPALPWETADLHSFCYLWEALVNLCCVQILRAAETQMTHRCPCRATSTAPGSADTSNK